MRTSKKKAIRLFIKEIDENIRVRFQPYAMECDIENEIVYVGPEDPKANRLYYDYVKKLYPECQYSCLLMSILHEIGHIMMFDWGEQMLRYLNNLYMEDELAKESISYEEACKKYFEFPQEKDATEWGIWFAQNNPQLMEKFSWLR